MENKDTFEHSYGKLINGPDIKIQRKYFEEMTNLLGIKCIYRAPAEPSKHYTLQGELKSRYEAPIITGCIFNDHPDAKTLKRIGWVSELQEDASLIHVPYDLPGLQQGALFTIPDAFNPKQGKIFRVVQLSGIMIYPASITCEIVPEYENTFEDSAFMFKNSNFNLLNEESEWKES